MSCEAVKSNEPWSNHEVKKQQSWEMTQVRVDRLAPLTNCKEHTELCSVKDIKKWKVYT